MPFNPTAPNAALYGVIPQAYAQRLATSTGDPTADAINALNLGMQARTSSIKGYEDLIRDVNARSSAAAMEEEFTDRQNAYAAQIKPYKEAGISSAVQMDDQGRLMIDYSRLNDADGLQVKEDQAGIYKTLSEARKNDADAGVYPNLQLSDDIQRLPWSPVPASPARIGYVNPRDAAAMRGAEARGKAADAQMVNARRPRSTGGGKKDDKPGNAVEEHRKGDVARLREELAAALAAARPSSN